MTVARLVGAVLCLSLCLAAPPGLDAADRPNVVVILTDDMGYSDLGCYGGEMTTPNLDRLAAGGLRFSQCYNTARCCPTRASLLTGRYPHEVGVGHMTNDQGHPGYRGDLSTKHPTIAEALRGAGYATYGVGKWHVSRSVQPNGPKHNWPTRRGFDRYYGTIGGGGDYFDPPALVRDDRPITILTDAANYPPKDYYYTDAIAHHAAKFVEDHAARDDKQPFFLYVAFTAAHWPMQAPEETIAKYRGRYDGGYDPVSRARWERLKKSGLVNPEQRPHPLPGDWNAVDNKAWESRCMEVYAAMIERMDAGVGRIVQSLEASGQLDNTMIVYLQDNGACQEDVGRKGTGTRETAKRLEPQADDHIETTSRPTRTRDGRPVLTGPAVMPGPEDTYIAYGLNWASVSNTPFREYKHFVHEGGISTPLIVHWPAGVKRRGEIEHQPAHLIDIMATSLDLAGATSPAKEAADIPPLPGLSLKPAFEGEKLDREAIYWEHEGNRAVRVGDWKLVAKENKPWELYDLTSDRTEQHDLAAREPERVKDLSARWETWAAANQVLPLGTWRGEPKGAGGSKKKHFELKTGATLSGPDAPALVGRPIEIVIEVEKDGHGVLLAQGATAHGYAVSLDDKEATFWWRRQNALDRLTAPRPDGGAVTKVRATVDKSGRATLQLNDAAAATGTFQGLQTKQPADALSVGQDTVNPVGKYDAPNPFTGKVRGVTIDLAE